MKAQVGPRPSVQLAESDPEVLTVLSAPTEYWDYRPALPSFWRSVLSTLVHARQSPYQTQTSPEAFFFFLSHNISDYKSSSYTLGLLGSRSEERHSCVLEKVAVGLCHGPWSSKE